MDSMRYGICLGINKIWRRIMNTKVSGCIVTYNEEEMIEDCISSILQYTKNLDFTLYVSDNDSKDRTVEIIKEKFPQVIILENKRNGGFGDGHNKILEQLDSEFHVVINPDIILKENTIEVLVNYLKLHENTAMVTPKILNEDGSEQHLPKRNPRFSYVILSKFRPFRYYRRIYTRQDEQISEPTAVEFCTGCFFVIRTKVMRQLGGFDKRYYMYFEDADLSREVRSLGYDVIFYPMVKAVHMWRRENTKSLKGIFRFLTSMVKYFCKWGGKSEKKRKMQKV